MRLPRLFDVASGSVLGALALLLLALEAGRPLRHRGRPRRERLTTNAAVAVLAAATMRVAVLPVAALAASWAASAGLGALRLVALHPLVAGGLGIVLLDYTTYLWHRLNHRWPLLWRFHSVHHTDLDLDVTTAFRFHVGELLASVVYRSLQVVVVGADLALLLVYEVVTEAATLFHHSNWRLPLGLERALNRLVVTPRMHGIHHSIVEAETNANWSVIFSVWDRLHRTLRVDVPQDQIVIGLPAYRDPAQLTFWKLLALPVRRPPGAWRLPDGTRPERPGRRDDRVLAA
jgi:sterol desaturase/sphingolipid hydroxylase (fatty acid hydroxylase superfamily)